MLRFALEFLTVAGFFLLIYVALTFGCAIDDACASRFGFI